MMKINVNNTAWISWVLAIGLILAGAFIGQAQTPAKSPSPPKIDLNKATAEQLGKCQGFTPTLARAVVDFRVKSGPFKAPEDLLKVNGVTKDVLKRISPKVDKDLLYVVPASSDEDEDEPSLKPSKC